MSRFVIGCGYVGRRVADVWQDEGHDVAAFTRSTDRAAEFAAAGLRPIVGDITRPESLADLPAADIVLFAVGYDRTAGVAQRLVYVDGLRYVLERVAETATRFVYISSTSVYGQDDGDWIDEDSPTEPTREGGQLCLEAEHLVHEFFPVKETARSAVVLRLAGIYGPGRVLRRIDALQSNEPIAGNPEAWLNLIHVDDAVSAVRAAAESSRVSETYLVSDDEPLPRRRYFETLARAVNAPPPRFDPDAESRHGSGGLNKRCRNTRLREELGVALAFPTIDTGLVHAVRH